MLSFGPGANHQAITKEYFHDLPLAQKNTGKNNGDSIWLRY
jgi:hypothetical protein